MSEENKNIAEIIEEIKYPLESTLVPLDEIKLDGRARRDFGDLQGLADSIRSLGLLNPPVLSRKDNELIGGERRTRAMQLLGMTEIPVLYREEMSQSQLRHLELHENIQRLNMNWIEQVMLIAEVHRNKETEQALLGREWFQKETGKLFGRSSAHVSNALELARHIETGDEKLLACTKITDAINYLLSKKEKELMAEKVRRLGPGNGNDDVVFVDLDSEDTIATVAAETGEQPPTPDADKLAKPIVVDLGELYVLGDSLEIMSKMKPGSVDHIVTDIPYGIDMENLDAFKDIDKVKDTHEIDQNVEMMPKFLEQAYRLLGTNGGYCVFFYDIDHHEKLRDWALEVGFKVQRWPLIWCKASNCVNKAPNYNFTKSAETAMVMRRGSKAALTTPQTKNFKICDGSLERKLYSNPFAKPAELWTWILEAISYEGQTILDPFAGQGSMARVALNNGLKPISIEIDEYHFVRGVENIMSIIKDKIGDQANFINDPRVGIDLDAKSDGNPNSD